MYDDMGKDMDYWKQYIKSESVAAITDIWEDARDDIHEFLDDWEYAILFFKDAVSCSGPFWKLI